MRAALIALAGVALVAGTASAQPVGAFADLPLRLNLGDTVLVDTGSDRPIRGTLVGLTPEALTLRLQDRSERSIAGADVRRVRRRGDPLKNGLLIGAVLGAVGGCLAGAGFAELWRWEDCPAGMLLIGPIYFGIAVGIDALHVGTTTVFGAAGDGRPQATAGRGAVRVGVAW
ncbi:MAG: hypothetical protein AB7O28_04605 [Vicinamibacterales bacterium]